MFLPRFDTDWRFYSNQPVASYEQNEIPAFDHLVVAAAGTQKELEYRLPGRSVTRIGGFAPQHLDFYVVSRKPSGRDKAIEPYRPVGFCAPGSRRISGRQPGA